MMKDLQHIIDLRARIRELEIQQEAIKSELTNFVKEGIEKLSPANLLLAAFDGYKQGHSVPSDVVNGFIGIATGFVSKLLFQGTSNSPVRRMFGTTLMLVVSGFVSGNPDKLKSVLKEGFNLLSTFYKKKEAL